MASRSSIRRRLLLGLIATIALLWGVTMLFVYRAAQHEVEAIYDATLAQEARVLGTLLIHEAEEEEEIRQKLGLLVAELGEDGLSRSPLLAQLAEEYLKNKESKDYLTLLSYTDLPGHRYESKIAFLVHYDDGRVMLRSPNAPPFDNSLKGFTTLDVDSTPWRVFGLVEPDSGLRIQVGEQIAVREETVALILVSSLWPMFVSLPLLGLIIWIIVGRGLQPLYQVADKVELRDQSSLHPISTKNVPSEVMPMVESLNRLFQRVRQALENERRFTANAAHELRTPLAALKAQAQALQLGGENDTHARFLSQIINGVDRTTHLLEQLLSLARADARQSETLLQQVDLYAVVIGVLSSIGGRALDKNINLSLEGETGPVWVRGDSAALDIMLRNLIDNAIRYTPGGGAVAVRLAGNGNTTRLSITDTGPGIPADQQQILFQRFQRGEGTETRGSGLGLSIVKQIVDLHGWEIRLAPGPGERGLKVAIEITEREKSME